MYNIKTSPYKKKLLMNALNNRRLHLIVRLLLLPLLVLTGACSEDEQVLTQPTPKGTPVRIAVVLPLDANNKQTWENTVTLATENIIQAQSGQTHPIRPEIEWHDENTADIPSLMESLAQRDDIAAIIGPYQSSHSEEAAYQCAKTDKPLFTLSTSAALCRYRNQIFLFY